MCDMKTRLFINCHLKFMWGGGGGDTSHALIVSASSIDYSLKTLDFNQVISFT